MATVRLTNLTFLFNDPNITRGRIDNIVKRDDNSVVYI